MAKAPTNKRLQKLQDQVKYVTDAVLGSEGKRSTAPVIWRTVKVDADPMRRKLFKNQTELSSALNRAFKASKPLIGRDKIKEGDVRGPGVRFAYTTPDIRAKGGTRRKYRRGLPAVVDSPAPTPKGRPPRDNGVAPGTRTFDERGTIIPHISQPRPRELGGDAPNGDIGANEETIQVAIRGNLRGREIVIRETTTPDDKKPK